MSLSLSLSQQYIYIYIYTSIYTHRYSVSSLSLYIYIYIHIYLSIYLSIFLSISLSHYIYIYVNQYIYIYIYVCVYICMYIYIYIYIYIHVQGQRRQQVSACTRGCAPTDSWTERSRDLSLPRLWALLLGIGILTQTSGPDAWRAWHSQSFYAITLRFCFGPRVCLSMLLDTISRIP